MMKLSIWLALAAAALPAADRKQELDDLLKILPPSNTRITGRISAKDKSWEDWVRRTGELPPDFDSMPSDPGASRGALRFGRGMAARTAANPGAVRAMGLREDAPGAG